MVTGVWWLKAHRYVDRAGDATSTSQLLGSARSGTTWLSELIDRHHDHRVLFEPFRPELVPQVSAFQGVRYLRRDDRDPRLVDQARRLFEGRFRNAWVDHTSYAVLPRRRLLKDVRANLLAPWLAQQFPHSPMVLLVRHPLGVAQSRLALRWTDALDDYLADPDLVDDHLGGGVSDLLASLSEPLARAVGQWAVETAVPLRMLSPSQVCLVHYEELRADPLPVAERVLTWIGQSPDDRLLRLVDRPSRTTGPGGRSAERSRPLLDADSRSVLDSLLSALGLSGMYDLAGPEWDSRASRELLGAPWPPAGGRAQRRA